MVARAEKCAMPGTLMFRRGDVVHEISRQMRHARDAMNLAKNEGREDDAAVHAIRMRAAAVLRDRLHLNVPVFVNASAIEARRAETAQHGSVEDESAVPQGDAHD